MDYSSVLPVSTPIKAQICVPGSKSVTNRALLLAALADGISELHNIGICEDVQVMLTALAQLGFPITTNLKTASVHVHGKGGVIPERAATLDVKNSGTSARFLLALLCLGSGEYTIDGSSRMRARPIQPLIDTLTTLGATIQAMHSNECFPLRISAHGLHGGSATIDTALSGQFLSALLMIAPYMEHPLDLLRTEHLPSTPYVDITLEMMREWGISVQQQGKRYYTKRGHAYRAQVYTVPPDASSASYFLAAAALTQGRVRVRNLATSITQGDLAFIAVLEQMGCQSVQHGLDIELRGPEQLQGIDIDMNAISDTAMTLAALAPFARDRVTIRNVAHIRLQESDRITAMVTALRQLGASVEEWEDGLSVIPSSLHGGRLQTQQDHRIAMACTLLGLRVPGVEIENPACVSKTFPGYFATLEAACRRDQSCTDCGL